MIGLVVFDLDGTLYFGDQAAEGAQELVNDLRRAGQEIVCYTNSSYRHRRDIYQKLNKLGFDIQAEDIYTSGYAAALYLKENDYTQASIIGSEGLAQELRDMGMETVGPDELAQVMVVGLDPEFNYYKLTMAMRSCKRYDLKLIACNQDCNYPVSGGEFNPGCGPIVAAIEAACEIKTDFIAGKPNPWLLEKIWRGRGYTKDQVLVIGDSFSSDIQLAINCGCRGIWVADEAESGPGIVPCRNLAEVKETLGFLNADKGVIR